MPWCSEAWSKLAAMPPVERLLQASRSQVDGAWARYQAAHDALVVSPCLPADCRLQAAAHPRLQGLSLPMVRPSLGCAAGLHGLAAAGSGAGLVCCHLLHERAAPSTVTTCPPPLAPAQADPRYASAVAKGSELLSAVQGMPAYKAAASRLTPYLAPAVDSIAPYVSKAAAHLAPAAA